MAWFTFAATLARVSRSGTPSLLRVSRVVRWSGPYVHSTSVSRALYAVTAPVGCPASPCHQARLPGRSGWPGCVDRAPAAGRRRRHERGDGRNEIAGHTQPPGEVVTSGQAGVLVGTE